jgi:hypothetical protein
MQERKTTAAGVNLVCAKDIIITIIIIIIIIITAIIHIPCFTAIKRLPNEDGYH